MKDITLPWTVAEIKSEIYYPSKQITLNTTSWGFNGLDTLFGQLDCGARYFAVVDPELRFPVSLYPGWNDAMDRAMVSYMYGDGRLEAFIEKYKQGMYIEQYDYYGRSELYLLTGLNFSAPANFLPFGEQRFVSFTWERKDNVSAWLHGAVDGGPRCLSHSIRHSTWVLGLNNVAVPNPWYQEPVAPTYQKEALKRVVGQIKTLASKPEPKPVPKSNPFYK